MATIAEQIYAKVQAMPIELQQRVLDFVESLVQRNNKLSNLDKIQIHHPTSNNVHGTIYLTEITENLLKTIAKALKINEQDIRLKISSFNQEKSLRCNIKDIEFIVEKFEEELLFNGAFTGTEPIIYERLDQLFIDLAQKNIQSCFEFYDENQNLIFEIS